MAGWKIFGHCIKRHINFFIPSLLRVTRLIVNKGYGGQQLFSNTKVRCRDHILIKMSPLMKGGSNDTTETSKMKGASLEFFSPFFS